LYVVNEQKVSLHPGNKNITENRGEFCLVQPEEFCLIVASLSLRKVRRLTNAGVHAQGFYKPRHLIQELAHQRHADLFIRSEFVGINQPVAWKDDIVKGEIIESWIESVLDYESAADVLDAVAQHRKVGE